VNTAHRSDTHTLALASLGAMTATVAHEMRNLLGGIELYATLVAEQCAKEPDLRPLTGRLLDGVTRLRAVAANLLSVSRRNEGSMERSPVDLVMLLSVIAENAALALPGTGVELRTDLALTKAPVLGDGEQIRQALLNLVINAVQAMPKGGVLTLGLTAGSGARRTPNRPIHAGSPRVSDALRLRTSTVQAGQAVHISIRDTGVGMNRATLRRAFEPFFTTRVRGTGIGLAVVREVAERHDARLSVTSRPGQGTTFTLTFELADAGDLTGREHVGGELVGGQHAGGAAPHLEQATHGSNRAGATRSKKATA
jgi:signal transduction histidine kinase